VRGACTSAGAAPAPLREAADRAVSHRSRERDPELRALPSGSSVCSLRIACNSSRRDSEGNFAEKPNFFDVSVYGAAADSVEQYMRKGSRVGVDGRLEWREWETSDQQRRQAVSVVADTVQFLDSAGDGAGATQAQEGTENEEEEAELGAGAEDGELVF
jgi:single-strand DNA-binding protein